MTQADSTMRVLFEILSDSIVHCAGTIDRELIRRDRRVLSAVDERGRTLLHLATCGHNWNSVSVLIEEGADVFAKDGNGLTARDIAKSNNDTQIMRGLICAEAEGWRRFSRSDLRKRPKDGGKDSDGNIGRT
jgi:ankyrin repeat protein